MSLGGLSLRRRGRSMGRKVGDWLVYTLVEFGRGVVSFFSLDAKYVAISCWSVALLRLCLRLRRS